MVLAKTSRKGKKAWRRNVDASAEEAVLAAAPLPGDDGGKTAAAGGGGAAAAAALPDAALFFEDKVRVGERSMSVVPCLVDAQWNGPRPERKRGTVRAPICPARSTLGLTCARTQTCSPPSPPRPPLQPHPPAPGASPPPACAAPPP